MEIFLIILDNLDEYDKHLFYNVSVRCVSFERMDGLEVYITLHRERKQGGRKWHQFAMVNMRRCHIGDMDHAIGGIMNCIPTFSKRITKECSLPSLWMCNM
jgi:hypothetical protein